MLHENTGSVPTVLHDATDTGTDYILKHLILAAFSLNFALPGRHFGGAQGCQNETQGTQKGGKMMPREPQIQ